MVKFKRAPAVVQAEWFESNQAVLPFALVSCLHELHRISNMLKIDPAIINADTRLYAHSTARLADQ